MRIFFLLTATSLVALTGCDPGHGQASALRDEFQHELAEKDKVIDSLSQKVAALEASKAAAEAHPVDPAQIADAVAEAVGKRLEDQNAKALAAMQTKIDRLTAARSAPAPTAPAAAPSAPEPPDPLSADVRVKPGSIIKGAPKARPAANPNPPLSLNPGPNPNPAPSANPNSANSDSSGRTKMKMDFQ